MGGFEGRFAVVFALKMSDGGSLNPPILLCGTVVADGMGGDVGTCAGDICCICCGGLAAITPGGAGTKLLGAAVGACCP